MELTQIASTLLRMLVLPPACFILLIGLGYLLRTRWPATGRSLSAVSILLLLVLSTNAGALLLLAPLEHQVRPLDYRAPSGAQAIVILTSGSVEQAPDYLGNDMPDQVALVRMLYGAHLQHATKLPILVTGGIVSTNAKAQPLASVMARVLREDFKTPVTWVEDESKDTLQNASFSARILKAARIRRVLLVTHAMHMPRAQAMFAHEGIEVVAAPTLFYSSMPWTPYMLVPSASGLYRSSYAMHEWIGLLWFRLRAAPPDDAHPAPAAA